MLGPRKELVRVISIHHYLYCVGKELVPMLIIENYRGSKRLALFLPLTNNHVL
jgi:hypothetical protein